MTTTPVYLPVVMAGNFTVDVLIEVPVAHFTANFRPPTENVKIFLILNAKFIIVLKYKSKKPI